LLGETDGIFDVKPSPYSRQNLTHVVIWISEEFGQTDGETARMDIDPPADASDLDRFLGQVAKHPDSIELRHRMSGFEAEVQSRGVEDVTKWSSLRHCWDKKFADYRLKVHKKIMAVLLQKGSRAVDPNRPVAAVLIGPPASGKTTVGLEMAQNRLGVQFSPVNPDDVKQLMPEYEGWNSTPLHDESAIVAENDLKEQAQRSRYNVVYDIVGRDTEKVVRAIKRFDGWGYDVFCVFTELPAWQAAGRAWERFQVNPFGRKKKGKPTRYVPPDYVASIGDSCHITFEAIKDLKPVKGYCHLDVSGPKGTVRTVDSKNWSP
jgi:hypothetical protein